MLPSSSFFYDQKVGDASFPSFFCVAYDPGENVALGERSTRPVRSPEVGAAGEAARGARAGVDAPRSVRPKGPEGLGARVTDHPGGASP